MKETNNFTLYSKKPTQPSDIELLCIFFCFKSTSTTGPSPMSIQLNRGTQEVSFSSGYTHINQRAISHVYTTKQRNTRDVSHTSTRGPSPMSIQLNRGTQEIMSYSSGYTHINQRAISHDHTTRQRNTRDIIHINQRAISHVYTTKQRNTRDVSHTSTRGPSPMSTTKQRNTRDVFWQWLQMYADYRIS